jgi:hypothetical protein
MVLTISRLRRRDPVLREGFEWVEALEPDLESATMQFFPVTIWSLSSRSGSAGCRRFSKAFSNACCNQIFLTRKAGQVREKS